jgi:putative ABC transport system permease protein
LKLLPWDYGVRNLGRSPARLASGVIGMALVTAVIIGAAGFVTGMGRTLRGSADPRNVILLGAGSEESVERSEIQASVPGIAAASIPGVRRSLGVPMASPEVNLAVVVGLTRDDTTAHFANFRGVTAMAFAVHASVRIVEGRAPGPGEILVGRHAATRMGVPAEALLPGASLWLDDRPWPISGIFEAPGTVMEAEIWAPLQDLRVATRKEMLSSVVLAMESEEAFEEADLFASQRLDLELVALREVDYYASLHAFYGPVRIMVWTTALLIAVGALLGGLNTLHAAFAGRVRELAALQVIGFSRGALLLGLVQEAMITAAAGSLLGAAAAVLLLDGRAVRISMGTFGLAVDGPTVALGLGVGLLLGAVGVLPPAWRCLRMNVAEALKAA